MMDVDNLSFDDDETMEVNDAALPMGRSFSSTQPQQMYRPKGSVTTYQRSRLLEDIGLDSNSLFEMKMAEPVDNLSDDLRSLVHHFTTSVQLQGPSLVTSSESSCACPGSKCRFSHYLSSPSTRSSPMNNLNSSGHGLVRTLSNSTSSLVSDAAAAAAPRELSYNLSASSLTLQASGGASSLLSHCINNSGASVSPVGRRNTMPSRPKSPGGPSRSLPSLPLNSPPELTDAQMEFVQHAGGLRRVSRAYYEFVEMIRCMPELLRTTKRDKVNLLMALCCEPLSKHGDNTQLYLHIFMVIMAMMEPAESGSEDETEYSSFLFARNSQEASALELAALTNKSVVVKYLALLYQPLDRDINEANAQGHTILHLMARKGDEAADSLETLLTLKANGKNLLRIDVLNGGAKTPLDVAFACNDMFQGSQVSYSQVIRLFHDTINEQVNELLQQTEEEQPNEL